jgi:hypothetical protein
MPSAHGPSLVIHTRAWDFAQAQTQSVAHRAIRVVAQLAARTATVEQARVALVEVDQAGIITNIRPTVEDR